MHEAIPDKLTPSDWRVEQIDIESGIVFVAIFSGPSAEERATEYANFKNSQKILRLQSRAALKAAREGGKA